MKKQIALFALVAISFVSCNKPDKEKDDSGCGCHAKENVLDLHGTTETSADALNGPTAKL